MPKKKKAPDEKQKQKMDIFQDAQKPESPREMSTVELHELLQQNFFQIPKTERPLAPIPAELLNYFTSLKESKPSGSPTPSQKQTEGSQTPTQKPQSTLPGSSTQEKIARKLTLESIAIDLAKKQIPAVTYGEIVTKTDKQSDLVAAKPQKQVASIASSKAIVPHQNTQGQRNTTPFIKKQRCTRNIIQIEPEFFNQNPNQVAANLFPPGMHYQPKSFSKSLRFYEAILIHSESVIIEHIIDRNNEEQIAYSKFQILKVLTPTMWGKNLLKPRGLPIKAKDFPDTYNYWDYVDAWDHVFWYQNKKSSHTWFMYFRTRTEYEFPQWFAYWWNFFGPAPEIFPKHVIESFEYFKQKFDIGEDPFPLSLHYCSKISMSWIFSWKYEMSKIDETSKLFPVLQRVPYSRWWDKFDTRRVDKPAIDQWFNDNPKYLCQTEQSKFLNQRSRITSLLSSTTDKAALMNHLTTFLLALQDNPGSSSQTQHTSPTEETVPEEEDYVVDLDED